MADKKFAFESDEVSIAFTLDYGMGDCIMAKKVFDALIELAPDCRIDIFCVEEYHEVFAKAFYGQSKNLNLILNHGQNYDQYAEKYDLALLVGAGFVILLQCVNVQRLQAMSSALWQAVVTIEEFNNRFVYNAGPWGTAVALRNTIWSQILHKNLYYFMACGGALPIRDDKVNIPLNPEFKPQFDALKLGKYITIYSNISEREKDCPKVKTWPIRYWYEYVARLKKRLPQLEIVQCGGGGDIKIENADRHFLGVDLELTKYILANSLLHVGGEGGLIHLATALGTKCLVLFGPSNRYFFGYDGNINVVSEACYPCMYSHLDFWNCLRGAKEPPCMLSHTPQTVCEISCTYLKKFLD